MAENEPVMTGEADPEALTVGFLHLGSERGGIHRDGRRLAAELRKRPGVRVIEYGVDVSHAGATGLLKLMRAARTLSAADVAIVPYSPNRLWAPGRTHLAQLVLTLLLLPRTVTVVHDVYPSRRGASRNWWALTASTLISRAVVFHEQHEMTTLEAIPRRCRLFRVPLPVEAMSLPPKADARSQLGVGESATVLAMVGWIHPRKNCERAIEVLARLPEDTQLWLIGSAASDTDSYIRRLRELADDLGVAERLTVTGYVRDDELRCRLAATDVALVPYAAISASASLSTIIGARRPVLASDLAVTRELHDLAPRAIRLSDDPAVVAEYVGSVLADPPGETAFTPILQARSPESVAHRFEQICRDAGR
jgi:glycosyltransferase involved in cell wall biosynthesis